jgi:cell division protein FtsQ
VGETKTDNAKGTGAPAPLYLRQQSRDAEPRRSPASRANRKEALMRRLSSFFLAALIIASGAWMLSRHLKGSPRFELHAIELRDARYAARSAVEAVFQRDHGSSLYEIPLEERRLEIEQIPWVHKATVTRVLPDRISVAVQERAPVAFLWTRRGVLLIDGEGVLLETPRDFSRTFPVLRGITEREAAVKRREKMQRYLALAEAIRSEDGTLPREISEVIVTEGESAIKLHLGDAEFAERYAIYRAHIQDWRQQFAELQSIDLRYEGQVVIQAETPRTLPLEKKAPQASGTGAPIPTPQEVSTASL